MSTLNLDPSVPTDSVVVNPSLASDDEAAQVPHNVAESGTSQRAPAKCKRVLHVINGEHFSGAERVQDLLALGLPDFGYEAGFACVKPVKFPEKRASQDAVLYDLAMKSKLDIRAVRNLAQLAKVGGFDLMHAHSPRSLMITSLASRLNGIPFVYHVHSPTSKDSSHDVSSVVLSASKQFVPFVQFRP